MAERIPEVASLSLPLDLAPDATESRPRCFGTEISGLWRSAASLLVIKFDPSRGVSRVKGRSSGVERYLPSHLSSLVGSSPADDTLYSCSTTGDDTESPGEPKRGKEY